jgi:hypothetical protein
MLIQFTITYDGKNDRHEIQYQGRSNIELVFVGGRAMTELADSSNIGPKEEQDVGSAIWDYLNQENISSTKDNPVFILLDIDIGNVNNAVAITPKLKDICQQYLNE